MSSVSGESHEEPNNIVVAMSNLKMHIITDGQTTNGKIKETTLLPIQNGTGLIYDEAMTKHCCLWDPNYPENPKRIIMPYARCCEMGLVDRCAKILVNCATSHLALLQHSRRLVELVESSGSMNADKLRKLSEKYDSVYFHQDTYLCALMALNCTVKLVEKVLADEIRNGLAIVRPPGHHAMNEEPCGYCFFNNVAIAATFALQCGLERILIVDWDVHHGQATQYMFYDDPRVLCFSIHRYEHGDFWPSLRESDYDYVGEGFNFNIPLNKTGMTDSDYLAIFQQILLPVAYQFNPQFVLVSAGYDAAIGCFEFNPQLVIISAGFDSALGDFKGEMKVSPAAYAHFTQMLSSLANGKLCVILEGGYCLTSLSEGVALTLRSLLGDPCPMLQPLHPPSDSVTETILNVIKVQREYWPCLRHQELLNKEDRCVYQEVDKLPPRDGIVFCTPENRPDKFEFSSLPQDEEKQRLLDKEISELVRTTVLLTPLHRTALAFDPERQVHRNSRSEDLDSVDWVHAVIEKLEKVDLVKKCHIAKFHVACEEDLLLIHSADYIQKLRGTADTECQGRADMAELWAGGTNIDVGPDTFFSACLAVGSTLGIVDSILSGEVQNGVAIVRSPGHLATPDSPSDCCFFNNVAIAAKYAQTKYKLKRIFIVDWSDRHGSGTQDIFYEDANVLYVSIHHQGGNLSVPASKNQRVDICGERSGAGYTINIPWQKEIHDEFQKINDVVRNEDYIAAFHQIVLPVAYEFAPDLVLVSAGFGIVADDLGESEVSPDLFGHLTHMLCSLAGGRVAIITEDVGWLDRLAECMSSCMSALLGHPCKPLVLNELSESALVCIRDVQDVHCKYWKSLKFRVKIPKYGQPKSSKDSHISLVVGVIDGYQKR